MLRRLRASTPEREVRSLKSGDVFFKGAGNRWMRERCFADSILSCKGEGGTIHFQDVFSTCTTCLGRPWSTCTPCKNLDVGRWIFMVMRYTRHHPESVRAGVEVLDRVPAGVSSN